MNEQQRKGKNEELYELQKNGKELNNQMIYSGDTKDLSALLFYNPSFAIKDLSQKSYGQIWFRMKKNTEFVVDNTTCSIFEYIYGFLKVIKLE